MIFKYHQFHPAVHQFWSVEESLQRWTFYEQFLLEVFVCNEDDDNTLNCVLAMVTDEVQLVPIPPLDGTLPRLA